MSLINEALRKARLEAARQEAADAGMPYPSHPGEPARRPASVPWLIAGALALVLVAGTGGLLFWLGQRSAGDGVQVAERPAETPAGEIESEPPATAVETTPERARTAEPAQAMAEEPRGLSTPSPPPPRATEPAVRSAQVEAPNPVTPPRQAVAVPRSPGPTSTQRPAAESTEGTVTRPVAPPPAREQPVEVTSASPAGQPQPPTEPVRTEETRVAQPSAAPPAAEPIAQSAPTERVFVGEARVGSEVVQLEGIAWSKDRPFALINGRVVGAGDHIGSLTITGVERNRVLMADEGGSTYVLQLR